MQVYGTSILVVGISVLVQASQREDISEGTTKYYYYRLKNLKVGMWPSELSSERLNWFNRYLTSVNLLPTFHPLQGGSTSFPFRWTSHDCHGFLQLLTNLDIPRFSIYRIAMS